MEQRFLTDGRHAIFSAEDRHGPARLLPAPLGSAAVDGGPWQEGTEEDPAWYLTD